MSLHNYRYILKKNGKRAITHQKIHFSKNLKKAFKIITYAILFLNFKAILAIVNQGDNQKGKGHNKISGNFWAKFFPINLPIFPINFGLLCVH